MENPYTILVQMNLYFSSKEMENFMVEEFQSKRESDVKQGTC